MGDLRLQAAANYATFRQNDLVKRCLYLFGGSRFPGGRVAACVFTQPTVQADDTWLFDYSLFFAVALEEYLQETDDTEALSDLYDVAMQQIEMSIRMCEETPEGGLLLTKDVAKDAFIDWTDNLEKRAAAQSSEEAQWKHFGIRIRNALSPTGRSLPTARSGWCLRMCLRRSSRRNLWDGSVNPEVVKMSLWRHLTSIRLPLRICITTMSWHCFAQA